MSDRCHARTALEELQAIDRDALSTDLTGTYDRTLEEIETLCAELEAAAKADEQSTEQPDTPEGWDADDWDDQLESAREKAAISSTKGTLTTKTIDGRDYYYLQWREGDSVRSQYVGPIDPA
jgi:hypothetical protein